MDQPQKQPLGAKIAALRKARGMTQAELAEQMHVTDKAVSKWERGLSCPDIGSLPSLAELFETSVDALMQGNPLPETHGGASRQSPAQLIGLVLRALPVAMGVAVTVLSVLGKLTSHTGFTLLGIGVACAGVCLLRPGE